MVWIFVVSLLFVGVRSEPVTSCLSEDTFQRASCQEIREHVVGTWVEVRRLKLPFAMYNDDDCVTWQSYATSLNETHAEFTMEAFIEDERVEGMDPAILTLNSEDDIDTCTVSMHLSVPKISKSVSIPDWWITFGKDQQSMVGYVCLPNGNTDQVEEGFLYKNMIFMYVKPQWRKSQAEKVRRDLQEIVTRLSAELKTLEEETQENYKELLDAKCDGV